MNEQSCVSMHRKYCATKINITTYRRLIKEYNTIHCIAISVAAVTITQTLINIATYGPKSLKTANYHQPTKEPRNQHYWKQIIDNKGKLLIIQTSTFISDGHNGNK
jgi:hypothetical protein